MQEVPSSELQTGAVTVTLAGHSSWWIPFTALWRVRSSQPLIASTSPVCAQFYETVLSLMCCLMRDSLQRLRPSWDWPAIQELAQKSSCCSTANTSGLISKLFNGHHCGASAMVNRAKPDDNAVRSRSSGLQIFDDQSLRFYRTTDASTQVSRLG
jgi:hypothetical protein